LKIDFVEFVRSATGEGDLPEAGPPEVSMVGRSNVGKSTLINALVKRPVARTSATPGKTRLLNLYRVVTRPTGPFYLVDLPGYGYARGRKQSRAEFDRVARAYFARALGARSSSEVRPSTGSGRGERLEPRSPKSEAQTIGPSDLRTLGHSHVAQGFSPVIHRTPIAVLLLVDARHPGMDNDVATCEWLRDHGFDPLVVVTKIDKLSRSERAKALDRFEQVFGEPALAVSAATGEGLEDLWKRIVSLVTSIPASKPRRSRP